MININSCVSITEANTHPFRIVSLKKTQEFKMAFLVLEIRQLMILKEVKIGLSVGKVVLHLD